MYLGRVVGAVVATRMSEGLDGVRLLWVQPDEGPAQVAADAVQAQRGERVMLVDGREAALALPVPFVPVDAAVVGHVDGEDRPGGRP